MLLQAVVAALDRFVPEPVLAINGWKTMVLMILTTCIQQHHLVNTIWEGKTTRCAESSGTACDAAPHCRC